MLLSELCRQRVFYGFRFSSIKAIRVKIGQFAQPSNPLDLRFLLLLESHFRRLNDCWDETEDDRASAAVVRSVFRRNFPIDPPIVVMVFDSAKLGGGLPH